MQHPCNGSSCNQQGSPLLYIFQCTYVERFWGYFEGKKGKLLNSMYNMIPFLFKRGTRISTSIYACVYIKLNIHRLMYDYTIRHIWVNVWLRKIQEVGLLEAFWNTNFCTVWLFCFIISMCYFNTLEKNNEGESILKKVMHLSVIWFTQIIFPNFRLKINLERKLQL